MSVLTSYRWIGGCIYLATMAGALGQVTTPSQPAQSASQNQATIQAFQQEQAALASQEQALVAQGATQAQLDIWHQQNASRIQAQQQRAQALAATAPIQPMSYITDVEVPENASQTMSDFLVARANLINAQVQIHNQLMQAAPVSSGHMALTSAGQAQANQTQLTEMQLFQQQNGAAIQAQQQRAQTLANETAQQLIPVPPPLAVPPNATPQLRAYLTAHDQLMRGQIQVANQYATADPKVKQAALQQWQQMHAAQIQQMQQLAQQLSQSLSQSNSSN